MVGGRAGVGTHPRRIGASRRRATGRADVPVALIALQLEGLGGGPLGPVVVVGGVLALVVGVLGRLWIEGRRNRASPSSVRIEDASTPDVAHLDSPDVDEVDEPPAPLLDTAVTRFSDGEFAGTVQAAYMHARRWLADEHGVEADGTHSDFYARYVERGTFEDAGALRELSDLYERAVFGTDPIERADARRALDLSASLTGATLPDRVDGATG